MIQGTIQAIDDRDTEIPYHTTRTGRRLLLTQLHQILMAWMGESLIRIAKNRNTDPQNSNKFECYRE